jgi:CDP-glucose 4,6-dehydratase
MVSPVHPTAEELRAAYAGSRVLLTGNTGFKGSWLTLLLELLGAEITGYALAPDTTPSMFDALDLKDRGRNHYADIRDFDAFAAALNDANPDYVFHLAAQPLVGLSYALPIETIQTNILGTAHVLEAVRRRGRPCVVVVVTSDKCYENKEWVWGYRECDPMGGHDIYSMSKGAAELVVSSYRRSYFGSHDTIRVASARAGNVIGGGDWAASRIIPDFVRATVADRELVIRNPSAVRPWQHVIEPLGAYLLLGARMSQGDLLPLFCDSWNFGPAAGDSCTVSELIDQMILQWGRGAWRSDAARGGPHEAANLRLNIDKAIEHLGWQPRWRLHESCARTAQWYRAFYERPTSLRELTLSQIGDYLVPVSEATPAIARESA